MSRPPRTRAARLLDERVLGRAFGFLGPIEAALSLAMVPIGAALFFGWPGNTLPTAGVDKAVLSTMLFCSIALCQQSVALSCRRTPASIWSIGPFTNKLLNAALLVELGLLAVMVYVPAVYRLLGQHPLTPEQWLPVVVTPFVLLGAEEARKAVVRARGGDAGR